jgi:hypothetical protein
VRCEVNSKKEKLPGNRVCVLRRVHGNRSKGDSPRYDKKVSTREKGVWWSPAREAPVAKQVKASDC